MTLPDGAQLTWRDWGDVASFDTMDEAVAYVKSGEMEHARCALRFKRNRKNPGTGGAPLKKNYICCTHLNCPMQVRAVQTCGKFTVQQLKKVRHASKVNPDSRRGGIFKQKDVALVKTLGTHMLKTVGTHSFQLCTTFVPLIYLMCLQHESNGECAYQNIP